MPSNPFLNSFTHTNQRTPIWLMRQAGRYMADYRRIREKYSLLEMVKTPELACEITLQPIKTFGLDAAIIFADILPLLEGMGFRLEFLKGEGPKIDNPIRSMTDIEKLRFTPATECLAFTLNTIRLVRRELDKYNIPLIGFSGAPFTLASYAIEGGSSKDQSLTKQFIHTHPEHWHMFMEKLSLMIADYLLAQAQAGAQVLQIFDSWAGALSPFDYEIYVMPHLQKIIEITKKSEVPLIYFSTGTSGFLDIIKKLNVNAFSIDWRIDIKNAWQTLGTNKTLQGNLDPNLLFAPWSELKKHTEQIINQVCSIHPDKKGFIFNLGHGILQKTPEDQVKRLVDFVKSN